MINQLEGEKKKKKKRPQALECNVKLAFIPV